MVLNDGGRLDPRRQDSSEGVRGRDDLSDRKVDANSGLKIDLLNSDAGQGLALHIADIADTRADRKFAVGRDPLFHLLRCQTGILPNDCYDRDVDTWENIFWSCQDRTEAKEEHHQCQHIECVPKTQREADDTHTYPSETMLKLLVCLVSTAKMPVTDLLADRGSRE